MRIALISATKLSLQPIENAIHQQTNHIDFFHLLDTSLITMLKEDGHLSNRILKRFNHLCDIAMENQADCIQLTCSAFNDITAQLKLHYPVPVYRSDEGMAQKAVHYQNIGIVSTFAETPKVLSDYILKLAPSANIEIMVNTELMKAFEKGDRQTHDDGVIEMIESLQHKVDVIVLAQYSISHVATLKEFEVPIIVAPEASIELCTASHAEVER